MVEKKIRDPKMTALEAMYEALKDLDAADQKKVLISLNGLLAIEGASKPATERTDTRAEVSSSSRPISLIELAQDKIPQTSAQRIALFAYYREKAEGASRFSRSDLKPYFAKAKFPPASNFDRDFVEAIRKGWIHEDGSDSYLTTKGIEAVESGFQTSAKQSSTSPRKRKITKTTKKTPREKTRQSRGRKP